MRAMGQAQPLLAHDLTELRRLSLLELAATHGDPAEAVTKLMARTLALAPTLPQPQPQLQPQPGPGPGPGP